MDRPEQRRRGTRTSGGRANLPQPRPRCQGAPRALLLAGLLLAGCLEAPPPPTADGGGLFDHPQALHFVGDWLVIANTHYRARGWTGGDLVVLDPTTGALLNRLPTSAPNPQTLRLHAGVLYVVATGALDLRDFHRPQGATDGALDAFDAATLATATGPLWSLPIPRHPDAPIPPEAPVDLAINGDRALLTSAVSNAVLPIDLAARRLGEPIWLGPPALGLGSVRPWREHFLVADFNQDRLHLIDPAGRPWPCAIDLGRDPGAIEGPGPLALRGDTLHYILTFSSQLRRLDLARLDPTAPGCGARPETLVAPVGNVPNDLHLRGDRAWIVDSGDNNLSAYDLATGALRERVPFPPGSSPWHAAWRADGRLLAVTEWAAHAVTLRDQLTGTERRLGGDAPPLPPPITPVDARDQLADHIHAAPGADPGRPYGDPARATNGVRGAGPTAGSLDVYRIPAGQHLTLSWGDRRLLDGPGPDLVVFENAFGSPHETFMELVIVELSPDGERWIAFPHAYRADDPSRFIADPALWLGFAGRTPVNLHAETHPLDPFDPSAGGDRFDLADLPAGDPLTAELRRDGARYVRLSAAADHPDPRTGRPYPTHPAHSGPDIDGVAARYLSP